MVAVSKTVHIDNPDKIIDEYNNTNRTINIKPVDVQLCQDLCNKSWHLFFCTFS